MPAGDIKIKTLKIGDLDLTKYDQATYAGFNIYEDILNPYGPAAEIRIIDHSDALGKYKINGAYDKDIEISISDADGFLGGDYKVKLKMYQNKDLDDGTLEQKGSGRHKQYTIRCVSPEVLNSQSNYMEKSYQEQTSKIVEDVLKNGFKTDKEIEIKRKTEGKRRIILNNEHPLDSLKKLNSEHVSSEDESSCFVCFQQHDNGKHKYIFTTFEEMFQQQSVVTLKQTNALDYTNATNEDRQNIILWFKPSESFFTPSRPLSKASEQTFNLTTHKVVAVDKQKEYKFKFIDKPTYDTNSKSSHMTSVPVKTLHDKANNKEKHKTAEARAKRAAFLSHLAQNSAELEVMFNPKIRLGSIITIDIPNKSEGSNIQKGEQQFNGKVLVVAIRTKIKPLGQTPRATMILRVVKASYKEGGNGNA